MKDSDNLSEQDLKTYAEQLATSYETSGNESAESLTNSLNALERRQKRFEKLLTKAARRYADNQVEIFLKPLRERISQLELQLDELESSIELEPYLIESQARAKIQSEITELIEENGSLRSENGTLRKENSNLLSAMSEIMSVLKSDAPETFSKLPESIQKLAETEP